jgi:hypothetical protein
MKKPTRNDPCPCGSGKKYKKCCLPAEQTQTVEHAGDRSEAVPRAIAWLQLKHGAVVRDALDEGFFGGIEDDDYDCLPDQDDAAYTMIMINAMEWLIADGMISLRGRPRRVADVLLDQGGPLFSVAQRQWIEILTSKSIGLYEVLEVKPGQSLLLKDVLFSGQPPVLVMEKAGSQNALKFDLMAARILPIDNHHELSGAVYPIPRHHSFELIEVLRHELDGLEHGSQDARDVIATIIPEFWLSFFTKPFDIPQILDHESGEPILLVTDHYRVIDENALTQAMSQQAEVNGSRAAGWSSLYEAENGTTRSRLSVEPGNKSDRIQVTYRTQKLADEGRLWFEDVAGNSVTWLTREIVDPKGLLSKMPPGGAPEPSTPIDIPPEVIAELLAKRIHQLYADWADEPLPALNDKTPREAIETPEGLEQVKFLLHTYEHGEAQQARDQRRPPVSFDFLREKLGLAR